MGDEKKQTIKILKAGAKCFIALWVLSEDSLSLLLTGYTMEVPIAKYFYTVLSSIDGWGIETIFMALGLGVVFYLVRDRQKNARISGLSAFFAICTTFGISYSKTNSWDCIFLFGLQFVLAVFVMVGYYFLYKNCLLFLGFIVEKKSALFTRKPSGRIERFLFEEHPFLGPFLFIMIFALPWLIAFFPGTLQWDAHAQLWQGLGVIDKNSHFPVFMTEWMSGCIRLGRLLFHSDSIGLFLYTGPQFLYQTLVFAYASLVMSRKRVPVLISWGSLLFWGVYPYFQIWGFTMVKDSIQYISVLLLVTVFIEIISSEMKPKGYQIVLFIFSVAGITLSRNDGRYVALITVIFAVILYRKYWKLFLGGACVCLALVGAENLYMSHFQISQGEVGEMLSIPLQQTARYLKEHYDEITEEEEEVLGRGFTVSLERVGNLYNPIISDPVKSNFIAAHDVSYLKEYLAVWFHQMLKHPDTYIQAFINHTYGYFYPNVHNYGDYIAIFYIGNSEHWQDGHLDIEFTMGSPYIRRVLAHTVYLAEKIPVVSMFLSAGFYVYVLLGEFVFLVSRNRRTIAILIPGLCVVLICMASPVNGYLRYIMPVMATTPVTLAWCYIVNDRRKEK
ncbi:MAG: hypothetical protein J1E03_06035 [Acetatifactor sp.]|nr:hypothetical protein [Acetatifactor sp.]